MALSFPRITLSSYIVNGIRAIFHSQLGRENSFTPKRRANFRAEVSVAFSICKWNPHEANEQITFLGFHHPIITKLSLCLAENVFMKVVNCKFWCCALPFLINAFPESIRKFGANVCLINKTHTEAFHIILILHLQIVFTSLWPTCVNEFKLFFCEIDWNIQHSLNHMSIAFPIAR